MEPAGVPALLAYRGGDKFAGLVPVLQEIPDDADLSARTLEMVLRRYVDSSRVLVWWIADCICASRHQILRS